MALPTSGPLSMSAIATEFSQASSDMSLYTSFSGSEASREACELDPEITYYHNGSGTYPVSGDNVFTDSSCEEPLEEDSYKMANNKIMVIGEDGEVTSTFSC